jgi:hypothetical protein
MKNLLVFLILVCCTHTNVLAQCTDAPEELFRLRLKSNGGAYGNPYTMFDRRKPGNQNFDTKNELRKIRKRINITTKNVIFV